MRVPNLSFLVTSSFTPQKRTLPSLTERTRTHTPRFLPRAEQWWVRAGGWSHTAPHPSWGLPSAQSSGNLPLDPPTCPPACVSSPCQDVCTMWGRGRENGGCLIPDTHVRLEVTSAPTFFSPLSWSRAPPPPSIFIPLSPPQKEPRISCPVEFAFHLIHSLDPST